MNDPRARVVAPHAAGFPRRRASVGEVHLEAVQALRGWHAPGAVRGPPLAEIPFLFINVELQIIEARRESGGFVFVEPVKNLSKRHRNAEVSLITDLRHRAVGKRAQRHPAFEMLLLLTLQTSRRFELMQARQSVIPALQAARVVIEHRAARLNPVGKRELVQATQLHPRQRDRGNLRDQIRSLLCDVITSYQLARFLGHGSGSAPTTRLSRSRGELDDIFAIIN